ncbi:MAG: metalloregulator ArsR/SmtB family transcription factor [Agarilytica sp.]
MPQDIQSSDNAELAQLLKSSGDELRLRILRALSTDSFGVLELCTIFDTKQSGMSHHLKVLANAQLVTTRKEGNSIFYRRAPLQNDDAFAAVKAAIFKSVDTLELKEEQNTNLQEIYRQRSQASTHFFTENAAEFKKQQDLIAAFDVYENHVQEFVDNSKPPKHEIALEVGPGAGEFLQTLAKQFSRVVALDNSNEMLEQARAHCSALNLNNVEFVHNDTSHCRDLPEQVDCAVINMVLHHVPSPQQLINDVAKALTKSGVLIICDLCQHDQDWTRDACGDLWLGFAPEDLCRWATENNLLEGQSSYFALRNGFQIQLREFIKLDS